MSRKDRVTEVLIRARARISDKRRWQRHGFASAGQGAHRVVCAAGDPRAQRWCALGAVEAETSTARTSPEGWRIAVDELRCADAIRRLEAVGDVVRTNDRKGHAAVLALFDQAIRGK